MNLEENILQIEGRIEQAQARSSQKGISVALVAVSKNQPLEIVKRYCEFQHTRSKKVLLGENYVQEFRDKLPSLSGFIRAGWLEVHLIGPLQRNKVKAAVAMFDVIEGVDSLRLLAEIDKEASKIKKIQRVFLQINVSEDPAKSGFALSALGNDLYNELQRFSWLKVEGLMAITRNYKLREEARLDFRKLKLLAEEFNSYFKQTSCSLSMGMSDDFEVAIEEGATHVRIGTALFGTRD